MATVREGERGPLDVYIGRPGRGEEGYFGNPYLVGRVCSRCRRYHATPGSTLPCFGVYLEERAAADPTFRARVLALRGRILWCPGRCKPGPCHGDVIVAWLAAQSVLTV